MDIHALVIQSYVECFEQNCMNIISQTSLFHELKVLVHQCRTVRQHLQNICASNHINTKLQSKCFATLILCTVLSLIVAPPNKRAPYGLGKARTDKTDQNCRKFLNNCLIYIFI